MTIHNIYIVAGVAFWLYILLYLLIKIHCDYRHNRKQQKQKAVIKHFFSTELSSQKREKAFRQLCRLVQDDLLLDYACNRYLESAAACPPEEAPPLALYMRRLLHIRAEVGDRLSPAARCLLMENLRRCGFEAEWIRQFFEKYGGRSVLESRWASLPSHPQTETAR